MTNKSKLKGTAYENKIKNLLTKELGIKFERVPHSGGLPYLKGDIWTPANLQQWTYCLELKHYKELNFNTLLTAKSNHLWSFWEQAIEEAKIMSKSLGQEKKPVVIFRWDRSKDFVMWSDDINLKEQMTIKAFGHDVKIGELSKWLVEVKKIFN